MNRGLKFVALIASLAVLAAPALALSSCWSSSSPAGCAPGCPMMAQAQMHHPAGMMMSAGSGRSCCEMSSGKPAPATLLAVPSSATSAPVVASEQPVAVVVVQAPVSDNLAGSTSPPPAASPQAVLCTFLV